MSNLFIVLIAVIPALIMMIFIYFQDNHEREPLGLLLKIFGLGVLSAVPSIICEAIAEKLINVTFGGTFLIYHMVTAFFGVAIIEEGFKFLAAYMVTWRNKHFNYKFDGVIYCLFGSMGFAAIENVLYLFRAEADAVVGRGIQRGLLAIPAHAMCAIFMGYFYGNAKYAKSYGDRPGVKKNLFMGFIIACSLHGFYDFCLMTQRWLFFMIFCVFVVAADVLTIIQVIKAKKENLKMYEAPEFRQYWAGPAANPYQPYGGYAAPTYGGYTQPVSNSAPMQGMNMGGQPQMNGQPMMGGPQMNGRPIGGQPQMNGRPMGGQPQMNGQPMMGGQPQMNGQPMGRPQMGAQQMNGQPMGGQPQMNGQPMGRPQMGAQQMMNGQPMGGQPQMNGQPMGGQPNYGQPMQNSPEVVSQQPVEPPVIKMDRNVQIHCPVCNTINSFHAFYCRSCGAGLHQIGRNR